MQLWINYNFFVECFVVDGSYEKLSYKNACALLMIKWYGLILYNYRTFHYKSSLFPDLWYMHILYNIIMSLHE